MTPLRLIACRLEKPRRTMRGERPAEGSSRISTSGSTMRARATASIWRWPPDSCPARSAGPLGEIGEHGADAADPRMAQVARQDVGCKLQGFRQIVSVAKMFSVCGTKARPRAIFSWAGTAGDVLAAKITRPAKTRHDPGNGLDEGGLARAIGAQHHDEFARLHREVDAAHDGQVALIAGHEAAWSRGRRRCSCGSAEIGFDHGRVARHVAGLALRAGACPAP